MILVCQKDKRMSFHTHKTIKATFENEKKTQHAVLLTQVGFFSYQLFCPVIIDIIGNTCAMLKLVHVKLLNKKKLTNYHHNHDYEQFGLQPKQLTISSLGTR